MAHQGETLQDAIKQAGFPISRLVQELGITRPTIYRKFREETLDDAFVKRVHDIIGRNVTPDSQTGVRPSDTSVRLPVTNAALQSPITIDDYAKALISLQQKHIKLLEDYNALLMKMYATR